MTNDSEAATLEAGAALPPDWQVYPDPEAVARQATRRILDAAGEAIGARGEFRLVLAGGSTPRRCYQLLAETPPEQVAWSRWLLFYGDERCLAPDDGERNSHLVESNWLKRISLAAGQPEHFPIPAELGAETGAQRYADQIRQRMADQPFDLVLLGMGEDGHTASLFPGQAHDDRQPVVAVHDAPKAPPDRVSLGLTALNDSRAMLLLITGSGKRDALRRWKAGEDLPIGRVRSRAGRVVLLDEAAADC